MFVFIFCDHNLIYPLNGGFCFCRPKLTRRRVSLLIDQQSNVPTENGVAADKYDRILDDEIARLSVIADRWDEYKVANSELSKDSEDSIDVATGQTRLLMSNKFQQFRGLIRQCRHGTGEMPVNPNDLEGFWTMLQLQVDNLDRRFNDLDDLAAKNWIASEIVVATKAKNKKIKIGRITKKATKKNKEERISFMSITRNLLKYHQQSDSQTVESPKNS